MNPVKHITVISDQPIFTSSSGIKYALNPYSAHRAHGFRTAASTCEDTEEDVDSLLGKPLHFLCTQCCVTFDNSADYDAHMTQSHGTKINSASCNVCTATFKRQDHLKRHIKSLHHDIKFSVCPVCQKQYTGKEILLNHIKNKHVSNKEVFHCRICEFNCHSHAELEKHELEMHINADRHPCSYCNISFKRKDHMMRHVKSQHLNHSINCPICNQKYKRRDHVTRHIREKHRMEFFNNKLIVSSDITTPVS